MRAISLMGALVEASCWIVSLLAPNRNRFPEQTELVCVALHVCLGVMLNIYVLSGISTIVAVQRDSWGGKKEPCEHMWRRLTRYQHHTRSFCFFSFLCVTDSWNHRLVTLKWCLWSCTWWSVITASISRFRFKAFYKFPFVPQSCYLLHLPPSFWMWGFV